ncbi:hypothetical protein HYQ46_002793 [Verticillium longisporum]|nr:hypothetical protein HYQ46_002793 [Verticillium longisporum]
MNQGLGMQNDTIGYHVGEITYLKDMVTMSNVVLEAAKRKMPLRTPKPRISRSFRLRLFLYSNILLRTYLVASQRSLSKSSSGPITALVVAIARDKRTSVACKYCRKRKIRCGGRQSGSEERCKNCSKLNRECIFAPASPISYTAVTPHPSRSAGGPLGRTMYGPSAQPPPSNSTGLWKYGLFTTTKINWVR